MRHKRFAIVSAVAFLIAAFVGIALSFQTERLQRPLTLEQVVDFGFDESEDFISGHLMLDVLSRNDEQ